MLVCLTEFSALPQVSRRAVVRQGGKACALAQRWCLTVCLTSDRCRKPALGLSITEPDLEFSTLDPAGMRWGMSWGHEPRTPTTDIVAISRGALDPRLCHRAQLTIASAQATYLPHATGHGFRRLWQRRRPDDAA
jgi:hypothetical protein